MEPVLVVSSEKPQPTEHAYKSSKADISKILAIIPSATELKRERKVLQEKRIRIKFDRNLTGSLAKIPVHIANELGIKSGDVVEIVVAGKKKAVFTAEVVDTGENVVIVYPADLERQGVSDNSIATIRKRMV